MIYRLKASPKAGVNPSKYKERQAEMWLLSKHYLVRGFLTNPVFIKTGQTHVVFIPFFPRVDSSSVRAL